VTTFHHVGLTVRDVAKSFRFYTEVAGMTVWKQSEELGTTPNVATQFEADSPLITVRSDEFDQLTNSHDTKLKYVMLRSADGALIFQLVEYLAGSDGHVELDHARAGSMHFSFFVDDVDAKHAEITQRGDIPITSPIVQITPSMRSFYATDPDGVPVEFLQVQT
jgi:catechol 2,3-dioxygenase-like lactoylglutathione lyase family enzyme